MLELGFKQRQTGSRVCVPYLSVDSLLSLLARECNGYQLKLWCQSHVPIVITTQIYWGPIICQALCQLLPTCNPHNSSLRPELLWPSCYRWRNWGQELSHLFKVSEVANIRAITEPTAVNSEARPLTSILWGTVARRPYLVPSMVHFFPSSVWK